MGLAVGRSTNGCQIVEQYRFMQRVRVCTLHLDCQSMHVRASERHRRLRGMRDVVVGSYEEGLDNFSCGCYDGSGECKLEL